MSDDKYLAIYLNDHLAGSSFGLSLARRIARENEDNGYGPAIAKVADEIEPDREALQELMKSLGVRRRMVRQGFAWLGEKAARLKPNGKLIGYSPLSRYIELETLSLGIRGKQSMWEALRECLPGSELAGFDIAELAKRAQSQRTTVEELRLKAAQDAFGEALGGREPARRSGSSAKTSRGRAAAAR